MLTSISAHPLPTSYLFIDGENLSQILKAFSDRYADGGSLPLIWRNIRGQHRKVFYFDAVSVQKQDEDDNTYNERVAPKRAELNAIEHQDGFHVRAGDVRHRRKRGNEQKMVDVQLAVDALLMASRGLFGSATLMTGDLDFKPLVSALVDMGVDVHLAYPKDATSEELIAAADSATPVGIAQIVGWLDTAKFAFPMPQAVHNLQRDMHDFDGRAIVDWHNETYGRCVVVPVPGDKIQLVTAKDPNNPLTHNLEIIATTGVLLRDYAKDVFQLQVPEW